MIRAPTYGAILASKTVITKALAILCALAIHAAHWARIAAAVGPDETLVARADTVVTVTMP